MRLQICVFLALHTHQELLVHQVNSFNKETTINFYRKLLFTSKANWKLQIIILGEICFFCFLREKARKIDLSPSVLCHCSFLIYYTNYAARWLRSWVRISQVRCQTAPLDVSSVSSLKTPQRYTRNRVRI